MKLIFVLFIILTFSGPLFMLASGHIDFTADYRTANRSSAHLAPDPNKTSDAIIQVYKARAFNWRGIFSVHVWIAIKEKNAKQFTVYQIVGWRLLRNLPPLMIEKDIPDRLWFNQAPSIIYEAHGAKAEAIIPKIIALSARYPFSHQYETWPGPNSNTFPAYIAREIPEMQMTLPSNAIGKDFLLKGYFARVPSNTGYQFSFHGIFGLLLAMDEGIEINLLGLVYGFSPKLMILKLPGFGDIKLA
jgi:hypothetical protein